MHQKMWKTFARSFAESPENGSGTGKTESRRLRAPPAQKCGKCGKLPGETLEKPHNHRAFQLAAILWIRVPGFDFFSPFLRRRRPLF
jgi:hypothetical protein